MCRAARDPNVAKRRSVVTSKVRYSRNEHKEEDTQQPRNVMTDWCVCVCTILLFLFWYECEYFIDFLWRARIA